MFKQIFDQPQIQSSNQNTQGFKFKTSVEPFEKIENNRKNQGIIEKDSQRDRALTNQQLHYKKPIDIHKYQTNTTNRDLKTSVLVQPIEQNFPIIQSSEFNPYRENVSFPFYNNKKNAVQVTNSTSKHRSYTLNGIPQRGNQQCEIINNPRGKYRLVIKKLRLKIVALFVRAALRFSRKYKITFQKRNQALEHFSKLKQPHLIHFKTMGERHIKFFYRTFVEQVFSKIIKLLKTEEYIKDYTYILKQKQEMILDFQKQRLCFFIKLIFQDLELITRKNLIPGFMMDCLNLCLFSKKNTQTSLFVANRTKFYSKTVHSLNQQQKVLIALEFLIFTVIIPNALDIANQYESVNENQQAIIQLYFISIVMLLSGFFTNYFKDLPKIQSSNVKPVQLQLKVSEDQEDNPVQTQLIISQDLEQNDELVLSGDLKINFINKNFSDKPNFQKDMGKLFSKIVTNVGAIIDISNLE
ncbi:unnamed protein product (macronuclear) [Paramecium tetraurelia]|uniref:Transmembrane protein n=1 Tax=Paramecium tetraurelia TaxID=5888 RepID=A0C072_PARTE|nr:uncharacterized protein GSPATT00006042001 [Paramecium tetraurelia]CAK64189.1 unnamed protein product [Paramecium tetraurelia]|eukprot:XP_001431587.1 hypothetical protein (macronuclear) [Paramecium tetraurelia strain d4-2]